MEMVWSYAKKHPHMEKNIWKFNCGTSRPFQKGSDYKIYYVIWMCAFLSVKKNIMEKLGPGAPQLFAGP